MESSEKIKELINTLVENLNEQVWFQELKGKWEELDPQSRNYVRFAVAGASVLGVITILLSSIWSVHSLKIELSEKRKLLGTIQAANDEMRRLRDTVPSAAQSGQKGEGGSWSTYFENTTGQAGMEPSNVVVSSEKAGNSSDQTKETLYELTLKHVSIKQVVRYAFFLENGQRPVKLRHLAIDTKNDPAGYLDAVLSVSAFTIVVPQ